MELPDMVTRLPAIDSPGFGNNVRTSVLQSKHGQLVFFEMLTDTVVPSHHHKAQWGVVLEGDVELTIGGVTRRYQPGDTYYIPEGVEHSARAPAGSKVIDFFEEADRYPLKDKT